MSTLGKETEPTVKEHFKEEARQLNKRLWELEHMVARMSIMELDMPYSEWLAKQPHAPSQR